MIRAVVFDVGLFSSLPKTFQARPITSAFSAEGVIIFGYLFQQAFGTLFRPRKPIHLQYAEVATSYGLVVQADEVKISLRKAMKEVSTAHPLYGKKSDPPLHYEDWWGQVIEKTFSYANVADSDLQVALPTMIPDMIEHFASQKAYEIHEDVMPCLENLKQQYKDLKLGILTNSDPRTVKVVESLGIVPQYIPSEHLITSWEVGHSKPSKEIFRAATQWLSVKPSETLFVGDDLDEDYHAAREAGLQAVLLQRRRHEADYVRREVNKNELEDVQLITSLEDLPRIVSTS